MVPAYSTHAAILRPSKVTGRPRRALETLVLAPIAAASTAALAASPQALRTRITADDYDLHLWMLYGVLATFCVVFAVMLQSIRAHRRAAQGGVAPFHRKAAVEFAWNAVPWLILFATAWPAIAILKQVDVPANADITIRATGLQWKWGYEYVAGEGKGIAFFANLYAARKTAADASAAPGADNRIEVDHPVVVPVDRRIRVLLAARDDIHSWHVPALGVKELAVPGIERETWFRARETGTYRGLCSIEACGAGRACVLIVVKVVSEPEYRQWVERQGQAHVATAG